MARSCLSAALNIARKAYASGGGDARVFTGGVNSVVPGRTDRLNVHVPGGAYVLPADIVSSLGEGNTAAGIKVLDQMFEKYRNGMQGGLHRTLAKGGRAAPVPAIIAGGEYAIEPEVVAQIGGGNLAKGHDILDGFVMKQRRKTIRTLKKLPRPARD